ncbi:GNAT family N-acetyltransferase [Psychrobacillus sp. NPDC096389]|uniref:GNAT family N-acetyltransferase n=1 Tax=Psychrobacillus sp. NPDC096389 TaxID=3364490 RepID=UPI0037F736AA
MEIIFSRDCDYEKIYLHLLECKDNFVPPLNERVELRDFAKKIHDNAITFCAIDNHNLVGLVSCYFNNGAYGFINHVSVLSKYKRLGIAIRLMEMCIDYALENSYSLLCLEVDSDNKAAIVLYTKVGFEIKDNNSNCIEMNKAINLEGLD